MQGSTDPFPAPRKYPCALTVMLLLVLLCPLLGALACAVEVMRPRGVSLTSE